MWRITCAAAAKKWTRVSQRAFSCPAAADMLLMDQSRRLQSVIGPLPAHVARRQPVQLVINQGQQLVERRLVSLAPVPKELVISLGVDIERRLFTSGYLTLSGQIITHTSDPGRRDVFSPEVSH